MSAPIEPILSPIREMYSKLAILYGEYHLSTGKYSILRFKVVSNILFSFYQGFVNSKEITPIEELAPDVKKRLWDIAGEFYLEKEMRVKASKAAYVLEVVSLNN